MPSTNVGSSVKGIDRWHLDLLRVYMITLLKGVERKERTLYLRSPRSKAWEA